MIVRPEAEPHRRIPSDRGKAPDMKELSRMYASFSSAVADWRYSPEWTNEEVTPATMCRMCLLHVYYQALHSGGTITDDVVAAGIEFKKKIVEFAETVPPAAFIELVSGAMLDHNWDVLNQESKPTKETVQ